MDRIIFGDNQFFGINHMSEEKAQAQAERFQDLSAIINVIDAAWECGVRAFMFNTHERVSAICDHFRKHEERYQGLALYPSMPYAHKYANAVNEQGILPALTEFIFADRSPAEMIRTLARGGASIVGRDAVDLMKLLVDAEMRMFRQLNVRVIFLQNIITDMLLGLGAEGLLIEFARYVRDRYKVEAGFNTMNLPLLVKKLKENGIDNPIACSSINKLGYLMSPNQQECESTLQNEKFRPMAMSVFASGAITPRQALEYVRQFPAVQSVVFGASSIDNIRTTVRLITELWSRSEEHATRA